jgi:hypothetical protein
LCSTDVTVLAAEVAVPIALVPAAETPADALALAEPRLVPADAPASSDAAEGAPDDVAATAETGSEVTNRWNGVLFVNNPNGEDDGGAAATTAAELTFATLGIDAAVLSETSGLRTRLAGSTTSATDGMAKADCGGGCGVLGVAVAVFPRDGGVTVVEFATGRDGGQAVRGGEAYE